MPSWKTSWTVGIAIFTFSCYCLEECLKLKRAQLARALLDPSNRNNIEFRNGAVYWESCCKVVNTSDTLSICICLKEFDTSNYYMDNHCKIVSSGIRILNISCLISSNFQLFWLYVSWQKFNVVLKVRTMLDLLVFVNVSCKIVHVLPLILRYDPAYNKILCFLYYFSLNLLEIIWNHELNKGWNSALCKMLISWNWMYPSPSIGSWKWVNYSPG